MKVLVIAASGMLGSAMFRVLSEMKEWKVYGTIRSEGLKRFFPDPLAQRLAAGVDVLHQDSLVTILEQVQPDVVVNCAGLTKHKPDAEDPLVALPLNALLPHRLARLCGLLGGRLIHVSTDCVFSGQKGAYTEEDFTDALDVYGKSKALGEVDYPHAVTLRTSIIGHELASNYSLLEWFLAQKECCQGYTRAIFSGLPTVVLAQVIRDIVIPNRELSGLYHVAADPIAKFDLLCLIAEVYGKTIKIVPDDNLVIDRSLNAGRFQKATGYTAPPWPELIRRMHSYTH